MEKKATTILPATIKNKKGFTLIEILIVVTIIGILSGVFLPRITLNFEPPGAILQRGIEEANNLAMSGTPVRFVLEHEKNSRRGKIIVEALTQKEIERDSIAAFLGKNNNSEVLEWQEHKISNAPEGEGWRLEPEVIYFYVDGSCTPAKISWLEPGANERLADEYILTVTGYCTNVENLKLK